MLTEDEIDQLVALRHQLHSIPELSGEEERTARLIINFLKTQQPDSLLTSIGGHGILATWQSDPSGPKIMLRAELDALPIPEPNEVDYGSQHPGFSHKCGHDGHMTMLCGVAVLLNKLKPESASISLLFQPAEETGKGAAQILQDPRFETHSFDHAFALHNIPGEALGHVLSREGTFCMASKGLKCLFNGVTAHASQPQTGISPTEAIVQLIHFINHTLDRIEFTSNTLATITYINIGEPTFGISPGEGEIRVTIRADKNHDLDLLERLIKEETVRLAAHYRLENHIEVHEEFKATHNSFEGLSIVSEACQAEGISFQNMRAPNPWSEDFGLFLEQINGAMFGLGSGTDCPDLHDPFYDFPDKLIPLGTHLFWNIIQKVIKKAT